MELFLKNPHSICAALECRPGDVLQVSPPQKGGGDAWERATQLAKKNNVPQDLGGGQRAQLSPKKQGRPHGKGANFKGSKGKDKYDGPEGGRLGGGFARVLPRPSSHVEDLLHDPKDGDFWLVLDSLQDPQNVGSLFRSASFFGARGVILTQERSAPLTATVYDISVGGVEYVPHVSESNLQNVFKKAKDLGIWILGTSEHQGGGLESVSRDRPWLLVLGNEEKGMRRLTKEACDVLCGIPAKGGVTSLNVSVAGGVFMSHLGGFS